MGRVTFSGPAQAVAEDPSDGEIVTDPAVLKSLHGLYCDESCLDYIDLEDMEEVVVGGGFLRFVYDESTNSLRITTSVDVTRDLSNDERAKLREQIVAQWSDGLGSGAFGNHCREVISTALAIAMSNEFADVELGDVFLDAYPLGDDQEVVIEYEENASADDEFVADLVQAVSDGDPEAMYSLGRRYETGMGVEADEVRAFELYKQSAEGNSIGGVIMLGMCLKSGVGCTADPAAAVELLEQAAEYEAPLALHALGECYMQGLGVAENRRKGVELYQRGADIGDPGCTAELGDCYEFGLGVEINLKKALEHYQLALESGFEAVEEAIKRVKQKQRASKLN